MATAIRSRASTTAWISESTTDDPAALAGTRQAAHRAHYLALLQARGFCRVLAAGCTSGVSADQGPDGKGRRGAWRRSESDAPPRDRKDGADDSPHHAVDHADSTHLQGQSHPDRPPHAGRVDVHVRVPAPDDLSGLRSALLFVGHV